MSGFACVCNLDGAPVDPTLVERLTASLSFHGPDAQRTWCDGPAGLGHALLRTGDELHDAAQPIGLDGVWLAGDVRLDARAEVISRLAVTGQHATSSTSDPELILRAYLAWGEDFVDHLLGDFSFALWDARHRKLVAARDHFGVKPFFYARAGQALIASNALLCVRRHPQVHDGLNDLAVADFLLFGANRELDTTVFDGVRRLPPAHVLVAGERGVTLRRYWTIPAGQRTRYARREEYVEHFGALLHTAVADRLRGSGFTVSMSGGLDSPAVAALAKRQLEQRGAPVQLYAHTVVYDRLLPDQERHFAGRVAESLGVPIRFHPADHYRPFERWETGNLPQPEPTQELFLAMVADVHAAMAGDARVAFSGFGADPGMQPSPRYALRLLRSPRAPELFGALLWFWRRYGRRPPLGGMRASLRGPAARPAEGAGIPPWIRQDFARRLDLESRWRAQSVPVASPAEVDAPEAMEKFVTSFWPQAFEGCDAAWTGAPLDMRHPFFDLRVITFLLSIPPVPWYWDKAVLREVLRGVLPEEVRRRRKAPLAGDPLAACWAAGGQPRGLGEEWAPEMAAFVEPHAVNAAVSAGGTGNLWANLAPVSLNLWLKYYRPLGYKG